MATLAGGTVGSTIDMGTGNDILNLLGGTAGQVLAGAGNDAVTLNGATVTNSIAGDDGNDLLTLVAGVVNDVLGGNGNDTISWNSAFALVGTSINGGSGRDLVSLNVATINLTGIMLNGGDDVSIADGQVDTLELNAGWSGVLTGANVLNWENLIVDGGTISFSDAQIAVSSDAGYGLFVENGGTLDATNSLALTGNATLLFGSAFLVGNAGGSNSTISGNKTHVVSCRSPLEIRFRSATRRAVKRGCGKGEWTDSRPKVPHWFAIDERRPPFAFAGIWRPWIGERKGEIGEHWLYAFLTTESNDLVRPIHAKAMPVILSDPEGWETWPNRICRGGTRTAIAIAARASGDCINEQPGRCCITA